MNKETAQKNVQEYKASRNTAQTKQIISDVNNLINSQSKKGKTQIDIASYVKWPQNIVDSLRKEGFDVKRKDFNDAYGYVISW